LTIRRCSSRPVHPGGAAPGDGGLAGAGTRMSPGQKSTCSGFPRESR
jgi:hypothetical protein